MTRHLRLEQRHRGRATGLAEVVQTEPWALTWVHRGRALQVRQGEVGLAVAAVGGAEQREQRRVLAKRQELAVAEGPPGRREVKRKDPDLRHKRIRHLASFLRRGREDAEQGDDERD